MATLDKLNHQYFKKR